jgi:integrase
VHDLIPLPAITASVPASLAAAKLDAALAFAAAEKADGTRRAYRSEWRIFSDWCAARDLEPLPALPETVARFLSGQAQLGVKASTIGRRCAAIGYAHRLAGEEPPTSAETVKAVLRGIRRTIGTAAEQKAPATADVVREMLKHCPDTLAGKRDRALLALGFAGAFRRSELVALEVSDLTETPDGLRVRIRRSKTDEEGAGQEIAISRGYRLRPVEHVLRWLAAAEISSGPIFREVKKGGWLQDTALSPYAVALIVQKYAKLAGLDPALFAGHSLRAGYVTSAVEANASLLKIAEQTRHRSVEMVRIYSRRVDLFRDHSGATFL